MDCKKKTLFIIGCYKRSILPTINFLFMIFLALLINQVYIEVIHTYNVESGNPTSLFDILIVLTSGILVIGSLVIGFFSSILILLENK